MRIACIDIGSNTTRLLVGEPDPGDPLRLREVLAERAFSRLRRHVGLIPPDAIAEVATTVAAQVRAARAARAGEVHVVATAAIRRAGNGAELCLAVQEAAGVRVEVLSGEREAALAFLGATGTLPHPPSGPVAVVDVGGASSELVCGSVEGGVSWAVSLPVGSGALADTHLRDDPPTRAQLDAVRAAAADALAAVAPPRVASAYAVGGSATSLRRVAGPVLDAEALGRACAVLCEAPAAVVADRLALHLDRARVLPAGMLLLEAASARLGIPLAIAPGGLREGVLLERLRAARPSS